MTKRILQRNRVAIQQEVHERKAANIDRVLEDLGLSERRFFPSLSKRTSAERNVRNASARITLTSTSCRCPMASRQSLRQSVAALTRRLWRRRTPTWANVCRKRHGDMVNFSFHRPVFLLHCLPGRRSGRPCCHGRARRTGRSDHHRWFAGDPSAIRKTPFGNSRNTAAGDPVRRRPCTGSLAHA
jgi:hypothetical protein